MPALRLDDLTAFGRQALKLDTEFSALARVGAQIQRLDLDTESGLEKAVRLLNEFAQHGTNVSAGIAGFAQAIRDAQAQAEATAKEVGARATIIQARKAQQNQVRDRLLALEKKVQAVNASLAGFKKDGNVPFSPEEQQRIKGQLDGINGELKAFLDDAQAIRDAARQAKFKSVERDAQALFDALRSSCRKLDRIVGN